MEGVITAERKDSFKLENLLRPKIEYTAENLNKTNVQEIVTLKKEFVSKSLFKHNDFFDRDSSDFSCDKTASDFYSRTNDIMKATYEKIISNDYLTQVDESTKAIFKFDLCNTYNTAADISKLEGGEDVYSQKIRKHVKNLKENTNKEEVDYFTCLVVGNTGTGKSCLINNVLDLKINERENNDSSKSDLNESMILSKFASESKGNFNTVYSNVYESDLNPFIKLKLRIISVTI